MRKNKPGAGRPSKPIIIIYNGVTERFKSAREAADIYFVTPHTIRNWIYGWGTPVGMAICYEGHNA